jgi:hypothetical protein
MWPWGVISLVIVVVVLTWVFVATIRSHARMASDVTTKASARDRYDAEHPERPRRLGEHPRDTQAGDKD